ncbi:DMT family transporter [Comamonas testosteroni]|uniref:DMT family transporter n=1 Tax=Comamonas testosteroni TaxID=285 RepID=A0A373FQ69_COMTE|nr:DMT family transporter [Comamonas testosteroni]RGE46266.1 DMT family transporter [Comamonas testosteroni]
MNKSLPMSAATDAAQPSLSPTFAGTWRMVLAMALSGTIGLLVVESGLPVLLVVWLRCLLGAAGLATWVAVSGQWRRPERHEAWWLAVGGLALVLNWVGLFTAYRYSAIAVATVVYHVQPFILLLLAALLRTEKLPVRKLPWLLLALLGVALSSGLLEHSGAASWTGVLLALGAATLYAVATLATQRLQRLAPAQIAMLQMLIGALALAWPARQLVAQAEFTFKAWGAVAVLGLVHTALMYTLMYAAFQRLSAQAIAGLSFIYPVVALLVDLLWFGHRPAPLQALGMVMILGAVWAYRRQKN